MSSGTSNLLPIGYYTNTHTWVRITLTQVYRAVRTSTYRYRTVKPVRYRTLLALQFAALSFKVFSNEVDVMCKSAVVSSSE